MKRVLCEKLPEPHQPTALSESEATHLTRVFRLKDGDRVEAMDGKGRHALVTLRTRGGAPRLEFLEKATQFPSSDQRVPVVLEMAVLKGDAMEWVIEKAVELGISTVIPVITAHTVVQLDKKGPEAFRERWQKIADQALKQCGRLDRLEIKTPVELEVLLAEGSESAAPAPGASGSGVSQAPRLWCDEAARENAGTLMGWLNSSEQKAAMPIRVLVGPEGGWSELEREVLSRSSQNTPVSLGPLVLRAETAAIFALSLVTAALREAK